MSKRSFNTFQSGAALVEFAIVLPLLILLALGISELSFAYFHINILNKSVQDGALYFSNLARCKSTTDCSPDYVINVTASTNGNVTNATNLVFTGNTNSCNDSTNPSLLPLCANYSSVNITSPDANNIQVSATYTHYFMTTYGINNFGPTISLTASSVMRAQ